MEHDKQLGLVPRETLLLLFLPLKNNFDAVDGYGDVDWPFFDAASFELVLKTYDSQPKNIQKPCT